MSINYTNHRKELRRPLKMPVAFFLKEEGNDMADYSFGWTRDVSPHGVCVQSRPNCIPGIDCLVTLSVAYDMHDQISSSDIFLQMKGQVVWNNIENQSFGIKFL